MHACCCCRTTAPAHLHYNHINNIIDVIFLVGNFACIGSRNKKARYNAMGVIGISSFRFKRRRNERFFSIIGGGDHHFEVTLRTSSAASVVHRCRCVPIHSMVTSQWYCINYFGQRVIHAAMLEIVGWRVDEDANGENCGRCTYGEWRADVLPTLQIDGKYFREQN